MATTKYRVVGVMSGTSLDGIDLAEITFGYSDARDWSFEVHNSATIAYSDIWKQRLADALYFSRGRLGALDIEYTRLLGDIIERFLLENEINQLDAVCSHGHTVLHQPDKGYTLQIGNLPELAEHIQQTVVCNFRVQDVKLGGQGAPLVPVGDRLLFSEYDYCINLGGFANVSFDKDGERVAFDICAVNTVLNHYAEKLGYPYDESGKIAATGKVGAELLDRLDQLSYYAAPAPKSLGIEWVNEFVFPLLKESKLIPADILRTYTEHIAVQLDKVCGAGKSVLLTGGGAYNKFLLQRLDTISQAVFKIPSPGIIDYKEAIIFGLLGVLKLRDEPNCLASVTGASRDHSSGTIFLAEK